MHFGKCVIYSPSSCSEPVWVSFFCWAQMKIFWRMLENKPLTATHWLPKYFFPYNGSQWLPATVYFPTFFICAQQKKRNSFSCSVKYPMKGPGWDLCCLCRLGKRTLISICQWWVWTALYTPWGWGDQKTPESGEDLPATTCFIMLFCCIGEFTVTPEVFGPLKCQTKWHLKNYSKSLTFLNHFFGPILTTLCLLIFFAFILTIYTTVQNFGVSIW